MKIYLPSQDADIVFFDPPYELAAEYQTTLKSLGAKTVRLVIAQHDRQNCCCRKKPGALRRVREIRQGDNVLSFYRPADRINRIAHSASDAGGRGSLAFGHFEIAAATGDENNSPCGAAA